MESAATISQKIFPVTIVVMCVGFRTHMKHLIFLALLPFLASAEPITPNPWQNLLANDSLDLWHHANSETPSPGWVLKDGVLHLKKTGKKHDGDLITKKLYHDFELKFEWKISEAGNSGVKYRTNGSLGLEYQILDDAKHNDGKNPSHRTASFYDLVAAPEDRLLHPVGEWNTSRIVAKGNHLEHWLNGKKVLELEYGSADWDERFKKSKYRNNADFASKAGPILLQDHSDDVWFRKIFLKEL